MAEMRPYFIILSQITYSSFQNNNKFERKQKTGLHMAGLGGHFMRTV